MHQPIFIKNLSLSFSDTICFEAFNASIYAGSRIGIVGRNGSGKSTLLSIIIGRQKPTGGEVIVSPDITFGHVPQIDTSLSSLSGAERFNKLLSEALAPQPSVLCLDEPTNHLDRKNRTALIKFLQHYTQTLIIISHDVELLKSCTSEIWCIEENAITIFSGYNAYISERQYAQDNLHKHVECIKKSQKKALAALQHEQKRAASSKRANKYENDKKLLGLMKLTGNITSGKHQKRLNMLQQDLDEARKQLRIPEIIKPSFDLPPSIALADKAIITITDGICGYDKPLITAINLTVRNRERVAFLGDNGSGKSTLVKALLKHDSIITSGTWLLPPSHQIGYLDQHYSTLNSELSVYQAIEKAVSGWTFHHIRKHLHDFLFRTNEEVAKLVSQLSGGECARLSLALIAAQSPTILILDEVTNNLDLQTKEHVIQVLHAYNGTLIVISHDQDFLEQIDITTMYLIQKGKIMQK